MGITKTDFSIFAWKKLYAITLIFLFTAIFVSCKHEENEEETYGDWLIDKTSSVDFIPYIDDEGGTKRAEANMADGETLTSFLQYVQNNYTYDHLILTFGSHGVGPAATPGSETDISRNYNISFAMCNDESNAPSNSDFLYTDEIALAFKNAGFGENNKIDMIILDVCSGGSIEDAYEFRNYAKTIITSPDLQIAPGYQYETFISVFKKNANLLQIGKDFVNIFASDCYTNGGPNWYSDDGHKLGTISFVDLSYLDEAAEKISLCADYILQNKNKNSLPKSTNTDTKMPEEQKINLGFSKNEYKNLESITGGKWLIAMYLAADNNLYDEIFANMRAISKGLSRIQNYEGKARTGYADIEVVAIYDGYKYENNEWVKQNGSLVRSGETIKRDTKVFEIKASNKYDSNFIKTNVDAEEIYDSNINFSDNPEKDETSENQNATNTISWFAALTSTNYNLLTTNNYCTPSHLVYKKSGSMYNYMFDAGVLFQNLYTLAKDNNDEEFSTLTKDALCALDKTIISSWSTDDGIFKKLKEGSSVDYEYYFRKQGLYPSYNAVHNYFGLTISGKSCKGQISNNAYASGSFLFAEDTHWKALLKELFPADF